uniref:Uncharacterized protein n=1 Tax=Cacopsylla melanoneura TaxID=428564 RepID=A0A8D8U643_9HEMI
MNTVATVTTDHGVPMSLCMALNNVANLPILLPWPNNLNSPVQTLPRDLDQLFGLLGHLTYQECFIEITVVATMKHGHINIADVSIHQWSQIRNTVTDHFID